MSPQQQTDLDDLPPMGADDPEPDPLRPPLAKLPPLAGFGRRLGARAIDTVIIFMLVAPVLSGLIWGFHNPVNAGARETGQGGAKMSMTDLLLSALLQVVLAMVYEIVMVRWRGQTVGKMICGIRIARIADGEPPTGGRTVTRAACYFLPYMLVYAYLGVLIWLVNSFWQVWDKPYRQCLHDKAAQTVVVTV